MLEKYRRIVILGVDCDATNILVNALDNNGIPIVKVVIEKKISKIKILKGRIKKVGFWNVLGQVLFMTVINKVLQFSSKDKVAKILKSQNLDNKAISNERIKNIDSVNDTTTTSVLNELKPDLIVLSGTRIVSRNILNNVNAVFVNIHAGITPFYRGVHGAYWALAEGKKNCCGVTLHFVDSGIDTGKVIAQSLIETSKQDNFITYPYHQIGKGVNLLIDELTKGKTEHAIEIQNNGGTSVLRYHPTFFEYLKLRLLKKVK
jgi:folate-dependent phosphoribosylglycinamide formyltransferase PurN